MHYLQPQCTAHALIPKTKMARNIVELQPGCTASRDGDDLLLTRVRSFVVFHVLLTRWSLPPQATPRP